jgi:hypothetical protein
MRARPTLIATAGEMHLMVINADELERDEVVVCHPSDHHLALWLTSGSDLTYDEWSKHAGAGEVLDGP